ncbi:MAG TPA: oligopeptide/dipeptide ABC transporter ATP-binding protein [Candidatus Thermoplasmatota archaeon]
MTAIGAVPAAAAATGILGPALDGAVGPVLAQGAWTLAASILSTVILLAAAVAGLMGASAFRDGRMQLGPAHDRAVGQARLFFWMAVGLFLFYIAFGFVYGLTAGSRFTAPPTEAEIWQVVAEGSALSSWIGAGAVVAIGIYMERVLSGILGKSQVPLRLAFVGLSAASGLLSAWLISRVLDNPVFWVDAETVTGGTAVAGFAGWVTLGAMACYYLLLEAAAASLRESHRQWVLGPHEGPSPVASPWPATGAALVPPVLPAGFPEGDLLSIRGLTVRFYTYDGVLKALDGVNLSVGEREIFGVVGETGCGKSVMAKSILRLIPDPPGRITGGEVLFEGINLLDSIDEEATIRVNARGRARIRRNRRIARRMEALMRTIRGNVISMIFQEPSAALNPVLSVRKQIGESFLTHQLDDICDQVRSERKLNVIHRHFFDRLRERGQLRGELEARFRDLTMRRSALNRAQFARDVAAATTLRDEVGRLDQAVFGLSLRLSVLERRIRLWQALPFVGKRVLMKPIQEEVNKRVVRILQSVRIPDPEKKADAFPFELSGGMQQRVMIAMALSCRPRLLIADEPTTALDVTIQAQILTLIRELRDRFGSSVILITHDLGVVAETCDRVGVMYAGVMAEIGRAGDIFTRPRHPYTVGLLRSIPETYARTGALAIIPGSVPSLLDPPGGCRFHPRCPFASPSCKEVVPQLTEVAPGQLVSCHLYDHPEFFPPETLRKRDEGLSEGWLEVARA